MSAPTEKEMTIVRIETADEAALAQLSPLFLGYLDFYGKSASLETVKHFLGERLRRKQSVIHLAFIDAQAVGFMQLYPSFASLSLAPSWILNDLFVLPETRGRGVATALLQSARTLAEETGAREIFLQTARSNATAQRLYVNHGYVRDDEFLVYTLGLPRS